MSQRTKDALGQLRDDIHRLQSISSQQMEVASKQLEAYAIAERMMEKLFDIIKQLIALENEHVEKVIKRHNNDAA